MKLVTLMRVLMRRFVVSTNVHKYILANQTEFFPKVSLAQRVVLINQVHSYPPIEFYAQISNYISKNKDATIQHYRLEPERIDWLGLPHPVLDRIFASFGSSLGLSWSWWRFDTLLLVGKALRIFRNLKNKEALLSLEIGGVPVGSLIYDTYLRRYRQETLQIRSWRLLWVLVQAEVISKRTQSYFTRHEVVSVFPGDVAYIYSGIVARMAILRGISTYTVVETPSRLQKMDSSFYRRVPYWGYREKFSELSTEVQRAAKQKAKQLLDARLGGKVDGHMVYMRNSAFAFPEGARKTLLNTDKPKILVLLHDFFDSPHIYRHMLFPDFWDWISFTLEQASKTTYEWYVKGHPNGLPGNERILKRLSARFPQIHFLNPKTSNQQLIKEGISAVFSVYGSAGHEFPYLGIPVVMAGDNPHIDYDFTLAPKTKYEYQQMIDNAGNLSIDVDLEQVLEFYYMHYLHYPSELPLDPVYPSLAYCQRFGISELTSKEQRSFYHKSDATIAYLIEQRTSTQKQKLEDYFKEIFG